MSFHWDLYSALVEYICFFLPPIGFLIALYGFFSKDKDKEEDLPEKIYEILRKQQRDAEEDVVCPKCGEKYKESYNACPWCGHKKAE